MNTSCNSGISSGVGGEGSTITVEQKRTNVTVLTKYWQILLVSDLSVGPTVNDIFGGGIYFKWRRKLSAYGSKH